MFNAVSTFLTYSCLPLSLSPFLCCPAPSVSMPDALSLSSSLSIFCLSFSPLFFLPPSLSRPCREMCCVGREVIWCRRRGVIDNGAAFAIRRAVFAFQRNETETQGIAIDRDKKATNRESVKGRHVGFCLSFFCAFSDQTLLAVAYVKSDISY